MLRRCKRCATVATVPAMERHGCECCLAVAGDGFGRRWLIEADRSVLRIFLDSRWTAEGKAWAGVGMSMDNRITAVDEVLVMLYMT
eukprot:scaffold21566_cov73-Cyclotella_meneghiniana.AAC.25